VIEDRSTKRGAARRDSGTPPRAAADNRRSALQTAWFGLMALGGLGFGLIAEHRPFGDGVFAHPLIVFFIVAGAGLLLLRLLLMRPVPEVISDRALLAGCLIGLGTFLIGNFAAVYGLAMLR
jgi:hypothetical protein